MLLGTVFVYVCVPETKGKSLEEIQQYFESKDTKRERQMEKRNVKEKKNGFVYVSVPEVTGKSLDEIHQYFERKVKKATGFVYVCVTDESKGKLLEEIQQYFESKGNKTTAHIPEHLRESDV